MEPWVLVALGVAAVVLVTFIARGVKDAGIKRFVGRSSWQRGAVRVTETHAIYFVATLRGADVAKIRDGVARSERRVHVWMTQEGRAGDPGRALLMDALHDVEWRGELDEAFEGAVRHQLEAYGVQLESLQVARIVELDDAAHARRTWWVCYVDYEGVAGSLCCDGLEFWLDAQGTGLWSLQTRDRKRLTSVDIAERSPDLQLLCHPAYSMKQGLLGGPLKDRRHQTLADMATPAEVV